MREFQSLAEAQTLALAIVDTLPEPFLVLDEKLHVLAASRCFYEVFMEDPALSHGRSLFDIGDGHWDIPGLHKLLEAVVPQQTSVEGFEFEQEFQNLGKRTVQLSAHPIHDPQRAVVQRRIAPHQNPTDAVDRREPLGEQRGAPVVPIVDDAHVVARRTVSRRVGDLDDPHLADVLAQDPGAHLDEFALRLPLADNEEDVHRPHRLDRRHGDLIGIPRADPDHEQLAHAPP